MKKYLSSFIFVLSLICFNLTSFSQNITVTSAVGTHVDTLLQNVLAGKGVILSNGLFNNTQGNITRPQIGTFNKGTSSFPFNSGLIMTTGNVSVAPGPNSTGILSTPVSPEYHDNLLNPLATSSLHGCASLEFDFVAFSDTFAFNYIFASEEYPEFVCSNFNDVFAFFLEGVDPVTFQPVTRNVAIIPNTISAQNPNGVPVTINSVNQGSWTSSGGQGCYNQYSAYYNGNPSGVQYDGSTTALSANAFILACQTYNMHLAIGNVGDNSYDSGVFLEAGSFYSPTLSVNPNYYITDQHLDDETYTDTLIQNCRDADVTFSLPRANASGYTVNFQFGGSAHIGQDYSFVLDDGTELSETQNSFPLQAEMINGLPNPADTVKNVHIAVLPTADFGDGVTKTVDINVEVIMCEFYEEARYYDTLHFVLLRNDSIFTKDTTLTACHKCENVTGFFEVEPVTPILYEWITPAGITLDNPNALSSAAEITQNSTLHFVAKIVLVV